MLARARRGRAGIDRLTDRQRQVLALMAQGCSNPAVARRLSITEKAVVAHISHLYDGLEHALDEEGTAACSPSSST
ncbi:MAG TPA: helix-turn-helix transcriptional regulator [Nakamurella sp.]